MPISHSSTARCEENCTYWNKKIKSVAFGNNN